MKLSEEMKATIKEYDKITDLGEMTQYLRTRASTLEVILPKVIELEKENAHLDFINDSLTEALKIIMDGLSKLLDKTTTKKEFLRECKNLYYYTKSILQKKVR